MSEAQQPPQVEEETVDSQPEESHNVRIKSKKKPNGLRWVLRFALLVAITLLAWLFYQLYQNQQALSHHIKRFNGDMAKMQGQLDSLAQRVEKQSQYAQQMAALAQKIEAIKTELKQSETNLQQMLNAVANKVNQANRHVGETALALSQISVLIAQAEQQWLLTRDASRVLPLLEAADRQLSQLTDTRLLPVRKAINNDLLVLRPLAEHSVLNLYLKVSSWQKLIDKLVFNTVITHPRENAPSDAVSQSTGLRAVLKKWFRVKSHKQLPLPPLSDEEEWLLRQNLQLRLVALQWFLLAGESDAATRLLTDLEEWLTKFVLDDDTRDLLMAEVTELKATLRQKPLISITLSTPQAWRVFEGAWRGEKQQ